MNSSTYEQAAVAATRSNLATAQTQLRRLIADLQHNKATSNGHDPELLRTIRKANADISRILQDLAAL